MKNVEMKNTVKGNSYWDGTGAYNAEQKELNEKLVPVMGDADTLHGEVLRCANWIYYEYFNNGNYNARDEECVASDSYYYGEDEYEFVVSERYSKMLEFISDVVGTNEIKNVVYSIRNIILDENDRYNKDSVNVYDSLIDNVVHFILTTENKSYNA